MITIKTNPLTKTYVLQARNAAEFLLVYGDAYSKIVGNRIMFYLYNNDLRIANGTFKEGVILDGERLTKENAQDNIAPILVRENAAESCSIELANDGEVSADKAVRANDSRLNGITLADDGEVAGNKAVRANDTRISTNLGMNPDIDNLEDGRMYTYTEANNDIPDQEDLQLTLYTNVSQNVPITEPIRLSNSNWDLAAFLQVIVKADGENIAANLEFSSSNTNVVDVLPSRGVLGKGKGAAVVTVEVMGGPYDGLKGQTVIQVVEPSFINSENFTMFQSTKYENGTKTATTQYRYGGFGKEQRDGRLMELMPTVFAWIWESWQPCNCA